MKKNNVFIIIITIIVSLLILMGVTYAFFSYTNTSSKSEIITGQIYMNYEETSNILLTGLLPETKEDALARNDENGVFEFSITGRNTSEKPIYYEIDLLEGSVVTGENGVSETATKIIPEHVMIYLERDGEVLVDGVAYSDWNSRRIYVDTIPANTSNNISHIYTLRMWFSENITISDTNPDADYTTEEWNNSYASLKVRVIGNFVEKDASQVLGYITYDVNGADVSVPSKQAILADGNTTINAGFDDTTFLGWSTSPTGEVMYRKGDALNVKNDIVLYAVWQSFYEFAEYYIADQKNFNQGGGVPSIYLDTSSDYAISIAIPDDVEQINVVDMYVLHNQGIINDGTLIKSNGYIYTNYSSLINRDFCNDNPGICITNSKNGFSYVSHQWSYTNTTIVKQNDISFYYNNTDKKIYVNNGMGDTTFYLAIQFVVPGHAPSEWEHFTNICPCLHSDTVVYVYDSKKKKFKKKKIKDVTYDDELLVWDFDNGEFSIAKPLWIKKKETTDKYNLLTFSDGSKLRTINQHRIYNKEKRMFTLCMTDDTPVGTTTYNSRGEYVTLISKKVINKEVDYYNVITDYHINLFTDNILTSCRLSNIYKIENMKYIKEEHDNSEYVKKLNINSKWIDGLRLSEQPLDINKNSEVKYNNIEDYIKNLEKLDINKF